MKQHEKRLLKSSNIKACDSLRESQSKTKISLNIIKNNTNYGHQWQHHFLPNAAQDGPPGLHLELHVLGRLEMARLRANGDIEKHRWHIMNHHGYSWVMDHHESLRTFKNCHDILWYTMDISWSCLKEDFREIRVLYKLIQTEYPKVG